MKSTPDAASCCTAHQSASAPSLADDDSIITRALSILTSRLRHTDTYTDSASVKSFLRLQSQGLTHEVFGVMFLDAANRLIAYEPLFRGTLTQTSVYPREVLKRALALDAASVILHHNHPSGSCEPSAADCALTSSLKLALSLVDVDVLDHIITSDADAASMREGGLVR